MDSPESGWTSYPVLQKTTKTVSLSVWTLVALLLFALLSAGIYFVVADVKMLKSTIDKEAATGTSLPQSPATETTNPPETTVRQQEEEEEDASLVVRFDYVDLAAEDIPPDGHHFIENVLVPSNDSIEDGRETIIILKNDDTGKKIFLRTSAGIPVPPEEGGAEGAAAAAATTTTTTTPKAFVYSPTIPQATPGKTRVDATTRRYNRSEDSGCFSTKIPFCEGILQYDVVQLPNLPGIERYSDLTALLPYLQTIVDSGCSPRARELMCSVLEPECRPEGVKQRLPCRVNCKVFSEECKDYILETVPVWKVFDCGRYPEWEESQDCLNVSKGKCHEGEFECSDGTCIPLKWVCNGVHDCPGSRPSLDESNCEGCSENEFRCVLDGKCVPLHWKCDGQTDCVDRSDETSC